MGETTPRAPSLRTRYVLVTVVLGLLLVASALYSYVNTLGVNRHNTEALALAERQLDIIHLLRQETTRLHQSLDLFLLDPTRDSIRDQLEEEGFDTLAKDLDLLRRSTREQRLSALIDNLAGQLQALQQHIRQIVETRLDSRVQYPAMALSAEQMGGSQAEVRSALEILINEIEQGGFVPRSPAIYPMLLKAQTVWANCISQMRIYLANRLASFSTEIQDLQARSVFDYYADFGNRVEALNDLYAGETDSFEGNAALERIAVFSNDWYETFEQVRRINESELWRADNHLMNSLIIPNLERVYGSLNDLGGALTRERQRIAESLTDNNRLKNLILAGFIAVFIAFVTLMLTSMEMMVFRPIGKVTRALKSRAFGIDNPQFYRRLSSETKELVEAFEEMTNEVGNRERALEHMALHDPLTGLPNRAMISDRIEYQLSAGGRSGTPFCLCLIDLNEFKEVNDSLGHQVGDALLVQVGETLRATLRSTDTIARLGGDEFAVLLPEADATRGGQVAEKLSAAFAQPFETGGYAIKTDASMGIAVYPQDGDSASVLFQRADVAMYKSKRDRQHFVFYDASFDQNSPSRVAIIGDLRNAIDNDELDLYYQPQKMLGNDRLQGAEALLRWRHPKYGNINPERVVEIAERMGIMNRLTGWVLENALACCAHCHAAGYPLVISVNISVHNLNNELFANQVKEALDASGLQPCWLNLEVTESAVMANPSRAIAMLKKLARFGISLSIDDYGTGFASLSYLKKMPVHALKIDKSFVMQMDSNPNDEIIVRSTIDMGHNLGLKVVAEGIENARVASLLQRMGCDAIQGYWLGRPMPATAFRKWLKETDGLTFAAEVANAL